MQTKTDSESFEDLFSYKLKEVDVHALEVAIAKAVSELVGETFGCTIDRIKYGDNLLKAANFNVSLSNQSKLNNNYAERRGEQHR